MVKISSLQPVTFANAPSLTIDALSIAENDRALLKEIYSFWSFFARNSVYNMNSEHRVNTTSGGVDENTLTIEQMTRKLFLKPETEALLHFYWQLTCCWWWCPSSLKSFQQTLLWETFCGNCIGFDRETVVGCCCLNGNIKSAILKRSHATELFQSKTPFQRERFPRSKAVLM